MVDSVADALATGLGTTLWNALLARGEPHPGASGLTAPTARDTS